MARPKSGAKHVNEMLKGRAPIMADSAERLERVLGHDAGFWLAPPV